MFEQDVLVQHDADNNNLIRSNDIYVSSIEYTTY